MFTIGRYYSAFSAFGNKWKIITMFDIIKLEGYDWNTLKYIVNNLLEVVLEVVLSLALHLATTRCIIGSQGFTIMSKGNVI